MKFKADVSHGLFLACHNVLSLCLCASEPEVLRMKRALESLASANDDKVGRVDSSPLYPHHFAPSLAVTDRSRPLCAGATNQGA